MSCAFVASNEYLAQIAHLTDFRSPAELCDLYLKLGRELKAGVLKGAFKYRIVKRSKQFTISTQEEQYLDTWMQ